jgi:four helix bundle protein
MALQIVDCRLQIGIADFDEWPQASEPQLRALVESVAAFPTEKRPRLGGLPCAHLPFMTVKADALKQRMKQFALDVVHFVRTLPQTDEARVVGRQLVRSGTGVAANYRSACRARSRAEFVARLGVALNESDESALWLEILTEAGIDRTPGAFRLLQESNELSAILARSCLTARERMNEANT